MTYADGAESGSRRQMLSAAIFWVLLFRGCLVIVLGVGLIINPVKTEALGPFCAGETPADWRTEAHWEFDFRHFIDANGDSVQGLKPDQCAMTTENVNAPVLFICANYGERFRTARLSLSLL